jgi:hypothetical protein
MGVATMGKENMIRLGHDGCESDVQELDRVSVAGEVRQQGG